MQAKKTCLCCNHEKPIDDFAKRSLEKDGRNYYCRECASAKAKLSYQAHREKRLSEVKLRYQDPEVRKQRLAYQRKWQSENRARIRNYQLQRSYGITQADYDRMLKKQNGGCAICGSQEKKLVVDHCHTHGHVRGLLCHECNYGLGFFRDHPELLKNAIKYLKRFST